MEKLKKEFYLGTDVVQLALQLIGKKLVSYSDGFLSSGIITETEAYAGETDKASHAYNGKRSARTEVMYAEGGIAYIYLCYGVHHLFNVVTNIEGVPHAVLIRALMPSDGIEFMTARRGLSIKDKNLTTGPGKLSQALGIHSDQTGMDLQGDEIWIEETSREDEIIASPRIGVDYAKEDALLP